MRACVSGCEVDLQVVNPLRTYVFIHFICHCGLVVSARTWDGTSCEFE